MTYPDAHLLYTPEEDELRASVRALLAARSPHAAVLDRVESDQPYDADLWRTLAGQVGVAGLAVPAAAGGTGASWRETAVVAEELGRCVAPTPYLGSAVLATAALLALTPDEGAPAARLLADLAAGEASATLAVPLTTAPGDGLPATVRVDDAGRLDGVVTSVADVDGAGVLLVPATDGVEPALYAVDAAYAVRRRAVSLDLTRPVTDVTLAAAEGDLLASGDAVRRAVDDAVTAGAAMLASEQLGLAEHCLQSTVEYLKQRHQFGRPVGSFQALKHRLAALWVAVTQARAAARYAAACYALGDPDTAVATAAAQSYCAETAVRAAEESLQLHGGIGFTWEHPAHLYLKRAKADALAFGAPHRHRATLAGLVDLPGALV